MSTQNQNDVLVVFKGRFDKTLKNALKQMTGTFKDLGKELSGIIDKAFANMAKVQDKAAAATIKFGENVKTTTVACERYKAALAKLNIDVAAGIKPAAQYFETIAKGSLAGGAALDGYIKRSSNMVQALAQTQGQLTQLNPLWKNWTNKLSASSLVAGENAKAFEVTASGLKNLRPEAQQYLKLTNDQFSALQKLTGGAQLYNKEMMKWAGTNRKVALSLRDLGSRLGESDQATRGWLQNFQKSIPLFEKLRAQFKGTEIGKWTSQLNRANIVQAATEGHLKLTANGLQILNAQGAKAAGISMDLASKYGMVSKAASNYWTTTQRLQSVQSPLIASFQQLTAGMEGNHAAVAKVDKGLAKVGNTIQSKILSVMGQYDKLIAQGVRTTDQKAAALAKLENNYYNIDRVAKAYNTQLAASAGNSKAYNRELQNLQASFPKLVASFQQLGKELGTTNDKAKQWMNTFKKAGSAIGALQAKFKGTELQTWAQNLTRASLTQQAFARNLQVTNTGLKLVNETGAKAIGINMDMAAKYEMVSKSASQYHQSLQSLYQTNPRLVSSFQNLTQSIQGSDSQIRQVFSNLTASGKALESKLVPSLRKIELAMQRQGYTAAEIATKLNDVTNRYMNQDRVLKAYDKTLAASAGTQALYNKKLNGWIATSKALGTAFSMMGDQYGKLSGQVAGWSGAFDKAVKSMTAMGQQFRDPAMQKWVKGLDAASVAQQALLGNIVLTNKGIQFNNELGMSALGVNRNLAQSYGLISAQASNYDKVAQRLHKVNPELANAFRGMAVDITNNVGAINSLGKAFDQVANTMSQKVLRTQQTLLDKFNQGAISKEQYVKKLRSLNNVYRNHAGVVAEVNKVIRSSVGDQTLYNQALLKAENSNKAFAASLKAMGAEFGTNNAQVKGWMTHLNQAQQTIAKLQATTKDPAMKAWADKLNVAKVAAASYNGQLKLTAAGIKTVDQAGRSAIGITREQAAAWNMIGGAAEKYDSVLQKLSRTAGHLTPVFQRLTKGYESNASYVQQMYNAVSKYSQLLEQKLLPKANKLREAMVAKGKSTEYVTKQMDRFYAAGRNAGNAFTAINTAVNTVVPKLGVFDRALLSVANSFKNMASYAAGAMGFYAIIGSLVKAKTSIVEFDQGLRDLQAILNITDAEMLSLGETVKEVAANTKYSTTEVADGMKLLGQAGLNVIEVQQAVGEVAKLATGTLTDFATSADLVTTAIRAFHMDFSESSRVVDVFASAINNSKLTVEKLRVAFNYIAPVAHSANVTFEETNAALMLLANAGIRASTMGTGFRQTLIRLINPTREFRDAIEAAGLSADDLNPTLNDLDVVFDNLQKVIGNTSDAIRFFHVRSLPAVMTFVTQGGQALRDFKDRIEEVGAAERMMTAQLKGLGIIGKQIGDKFTVLSASMGQAGFAGALELVGRILHVVLDVLNKLVNNALTSFVITLGLAVSALKAFGAVLRLIKATAFGAWFVTAGAGIKAFTATVLAGTATFTAFKAALVAAVVKISALLGPVGWLTAAILSLATAYKFWNDANLKVIHSTKEQIQSIDSTVKSLDTLIGNIKKADEEGRNWTKLLERATYDNYELAKALEDVGDNAEDVIEAIEKFQDQQLETKILAAKDAFASANKEFEKTGVRLRDNTARLESHNNVWIKSERLIRYWQRRVREAADDHNAAISHMVSQIEHLMEAYIAQGYTTDQARNKIAEWGQSLGLSERATAQFNKSLDSVTTRFQLLISTVRDARLTPQLAKLAQEFKQHAKEIQDAFNEYDREVEISLRNLDRNFDEHAGNYNEQAERIINSLRLNLQDRLRVILNDSSIELKNYSENTIRFLDVAGEAWASFYDDLTFEGQVEFEAALADIERAVVEHGEKLKALGFNQFEQERAMADKRKKLSDDLLRSIYQKQVDHYGQITNLMNQAENTLAQVKIQSIERQSQIHKEGVDRRIAEIDRELQYETSMINARVDLERDRNFQINVITQDAFNERRQLYEEYYEEQKKRIQLIAEIEQNAADENVRRHLETYNAILQHGAGYVQSIQDQERDIRRITENGSREALESRRRMYASLENLAKDYVRQLEAMLQQEINAHAQAAREIARIRKELNAIEGQQFEYINNLRRRHMNEQQQAENDRMMFDRQMSLARQALAAGDYEAVKRYLDSARGYASNLHKELDVVANQYDIHGNKIGTVTKKVDLRNEAEQKIIQTFDLQRQAGRAALQEQSQNAAMAEINIRSLQGALNDVYQELEKLQTAQFVLDIQLAQLEVNEIERQVSELRAKIKNDPIALSLTLEQGSQESVTAELDAIRMNLNHLQLVALRIEATGPDGEEKLTDYITTVKNVVDVALREIDGIPNGSVGVDFVGNVGGSSAELGESITNAQRMLDDFLRGFGTLQEGQIIVHMLGDGSATLPLSEKIAQMADLLQRFVEGIQKEITLIVHFSQVTEAKEEYEKLVEAVEKADTETTSRHETQGVEESIEVYEQLIDIFDGVDRDTESSHQINVDETGLDLLTGTYAMHEDLDGEETQSKHNIEIDKAKVSNLADAHSLHGALDDEETASSHQIELDEEQIADLFSVYGAHDELDGWDSDSSHEIEVGDWEDLEYTYNLHAALDEQDTTESEHEIQIDSEELKNLARTYFYHKTFSEDREIAHTLSTHDITVTGLADLISAWKYHNQLDGLHTKSYHTIYVTKVYTNNAGGFIGDVEETHKLATGGVVPGGKGTKDDVPALLTRGEYVQPVSVVDYYGRGFMEALRSKLIPKDLAQGFNKGGFADYYPKNKSSFSDLTNIARYNKGGFVEEHKSGFTANVNLNLGGKIYEAKMDEKMARDFVERIKFIDKRMH